MSIAFDHQPHPRIAARKKAGPPRSTDEHVGLNGRVALLLTTAVGTMWCAYVFAILAFIALPDALGGGLLPLVQTARAMMDALPSEALRDLEPASQYRIL